MRLSEDRVVQLVESVPPQIVLKDDTSGAEITLDSETTAKLRIALEYFAEAMGDPTAEILPAATERLLDALLASAQARVLLIQNEQLNRTNK